MAENEQNVNEEVVTPSPEEVLVQMKENMVPKEEAAKWQQKYNELFRSVANGTFSGEDTKAPTETELKEAFLNNVKGLSDYSTSMLDKENIEKLLEFDSYLTAHGRRSAFASSDSLEDGRKAEQLRSFLSTASAQETERQISTWTIDHLNDNDGFDGESNRLFG
mgnify:CR=1 FL=1|uniref:Uncharacterized protein n=1 Tax=Herelleviridae sp. ct7M529 TaxID=2826787 RepID=A0A8S5LWC1_9CAUD|nr:MAG TPA: hypothetical protein [Herelleviridae sp. ct7M529]